ncbi:MAG: MBL fold metallo-hydrolase [Synechococcaceae bacterium WB9_4xB_025]|nr:MBL fold metallo-hydrolase [Synechococcaceae bacterium WB9_4xB_025]
MVAAPLLLSAAGGTSLLLRQLFDAETGTFTYLLVDVPSTKGVLIDPVFERHERDLALLRELGVHLVACLDTHAHADHVTGSWLMHEATGSDIGLATVARAVHVTLPLGHGDRVAFGARALEVRATPGHTDGCLTYVLDDHSAAFTGDALLIRGCGRCDFQQGDARTLYRSITEQILSLPDQCLLYPGHDYSGRQVTSVAEERALNARLGGGADERDFVIHMDSLKLPHPHRIAQALPANLRSGRPQGDGPDQPEWAPLKRSYAGLPELEPEWVADHLTELTILDVRNADEAHGPDGALPGSRNIPLPELVEHLDRLDPEAPTVVFCHAGSRSALATQQLIKAGFKRVANLRGGLQDWYRKGLPMPEPLSI